MQTPPQAPPQNCPQVPPPPPAEPERPLPKGLWFEARPGSDQPYRVRWREVGGQKRGASFATEAERWAFVDRFEERREDWGKSAEMPHPRDTQVWRLFREMTGGADPLEVARFWLRHRDVRGGQMTVEDAVRRFHETRAGRRVAQDSKSHLELHLRRFVAFAGSKRLADVSADLIRQWLDAMQEEQPPAWLEHRRKWNPFEPYTLKHHLTSVQLLFARAKLERWCEHDPAALIEDPEWDPGEICILTVDEARALFSANRTRPAVGRLALEAFAGTRYSFASRIHREDILTDEKGIVFPGKKHKERARNYVDGYPDNLWLWLAATPAACWDLTERDYLDAKAEAFDRAGVKNPGNVLRHSFATYHLALHKNHNVTATLLTHRNTQTIYRHYKGRASAAAGKAYFEIVP
jgi:site-specific recombinase XerD